MDEDYRKSIHRLKRIAESAKRRAQVYSDLARIDDKGTAKSLGALQRASAPGKKLQKIGFILFWVPEPLGITNAIGGPMIIAGKYLERVYNSATISDVGHETKSTVSTISSFRETIK